MLGMVVAGSACHAEMKDTTKCVLSTMPWASMQVQANYISSGDRCAVLCTVSGQIFILDQTLIREVINARDEFSPSGDSLVIWLMNSCLQQLETPKTISADQ
jgi:hypothetical protein